MKPAISRYNRIECMCSILGKDVLKLNKNWQAIGVINVRKAFDMMFSGAATALDCEEDSMLPTKLEDWIHLPVRDQDEFIQTVRYQIRVPRVVIAVRYDKLVIRSPKLTLKNLRIRDKDTCIYSGKKLKENEMSIEHIIPQSKGGRTVWENVALADRDINSRRSNRPLEELGLKLRFKPYAPKPSMPSEFIENKEKYPEWELFLNS